MCFLNYLLTFQTTTAAFTADKFLTDSKKQLKKSIEAIPFKLTDTCYGLGIKIETTEKIMKDVYKQLKDNGINLKHCWQDVNFDGNYIIADNNLRS